MPMWSWITGTESEHNLLPPSFFSAVSLKLLFLSKSFVQCCWCLSKDKFSSRKPPCCHMHFCLRLRMEDSKWSCSSHEHFMDLILSQWAQMRSYPSALPKSCKGASCTTVSLPAAVWIMTEMTPQAWQTWAQWYTGLESPRPLGQPTFWQHEHTPPLLNPSSLPQSPAGL